MSIVLDTHVQATAKTGLAEMVYLWFVRLAAVLCLIATVGYWSGLAGLSTFFGVVQVGNATTAVTTLNVCLAVLFPVAMLGLWLRTRWGVTVWLIILLSQVILHTVAAATFGERPGIVLANLAAISAYMLVAGYLLFRRRQVV